MRVEREGFFIASQIWTCAPSSTTRFGGKPKKAALAAVARKLLVAINAMLRDRRAWQPTLIVQPSCC